MRRRIRWARDKLRKPKERLVPYVATGPGNPSPRPVPLLSITAPTGGSTTADTTPTLTGTASGTTPVTVEVLEGGLVLQTLSNTPTGGVWTVTADTLVAGSYEVMARQTVDGQTGASGPLGFTVGTAPVRTPPPVVLTGPANGSSSGDTTPAFTGTCGDRAGDSPDVTVRLFQSNIQVDVQTVPRAGTVWAIFNWYRALSTGTYQARAEQVDTTLSPPNNVGMSGINTFTVSAAVSSSLAVTSPANNGTTSDTTPTFVGTAQTAAGASSTVTLKVRFVSSPSGSTVRRPGLMTWYYPWFPQTWGSTSWPTESGRFCHFTPTLGYYDSSSTAIQDSHIRSLQYGNVQMVSMSWWGTNTATGVTTPGTSFRDVQMRRMMDRANVLGSPIKFSVYYEPYWARSIPEDVNSVARLTSDLNYIWHTMANVAEVSRGSRYAFKNGKPVLWVYNIDRWYTGTWSATRNYAVWEKVVYGPNQYRCLVAGVSAAPPDTNPTKWDLQTTTERNAHLQACADNFATANAAADRPFYINLKLAGIWRTVTPQPDSWHQYGSRDDKESQALGAPATTPGYWKMPVGGHWLASHATIGADPNGIPRSVPRWTAGIADMRTNGQSYEWWIADTFNEWGEGHCMESARLADSPELPWESASGHGDYVDALAAASPLQVPNDPFLVQQRTATRSGGNWSVDATALATGTWSVTAEQVVSGTTVLSTPKVFTVVTGAAFSPPLSVSGQRIVDTTGTTKVLRGANMMSQEWDGNMTNEVAGIPVLKNDWGGNIVTKGFASGPVNSGDATYLAQLDQYVSLTLANQLYMAFVYRTPLQNGDPQPELPDAAATTALTALAARYKNSPHVIFGLQVEPHGASAVWGNASSGMCKLFFDMITSIRGASGSNNPNFPLILVPGYDWSRNLSGAIGNPVAKPNVVYKTHPYNNSSQFQALFGTAHDAGLPVFVGEFAPNVDMTQADVNTLLTFTRSRNIGWAAWLFDTRTENLLTDWTGTPSSPYGVAVRTEMLLPR